MSDKKASNIRYIRTDDRAWELLKQYAAMHGNPMGYTFSQMVYGVTGVRPWGDIAEWRAVMKKEGNKE